MSNRHPFVANPTGKTPVNAVLNKFPSTNTDVIDDMPFVFDFFDEKEMTAPLESEPVNIFLKNFQEVF